MAQTITWAASPPGDQTSVGFQGGNNGQKSAASFVPNANYTNFTPTLSLWKVLAPGDNVLIEIETDTAGAPSGTVIGTVTVAAASLGTTALVATTNWGTANASLSNGTTYWLVVERSGALSTTDYYGLGITASGAGISRFGSDTGTWAALAGFEFAGSLVLDTAAATTTPTLMLMGVGT